MCGSCLQQLDPAGAGLEELKSKYRAELAAAYLHKLAIDTTTSEKPISETLAIDTMTKKPTDQVMDKPLAAANHVHAASHEVASNQSRPCTMFEVKVGVHGETKHIASIIASESDSETAGASSPFCLHSKAIVTMKLWCGLGWLFI